MKKSKNKHVKKNLKNKKIKQVSPKVMESSLLAEKLTIKPQLLVQNKISYTPKVSIIIPVYNVGEYLRQCLDSIIHQTLKEIEIICVNDGSTDNSLDILQEYASHDSRISIYSSVHVGTGKCRNCALEVVKGEYIGFVDPDDWVEEEYFEKLYNAGTPEASDIVFQTNRIEINPEINRQVVIGTDSAKNDLAYRFNIIQQSAHLWSKIFRKNFIDKFKLRNAYTKRSQDLLFTIPAILLADKIVCVENAKYFYRKGHKSVCQAAYTEKEIRDISDVYQQIYSILDQENPNVKSLVQLKENLFYKRNFPQLTKSEQHNLRSFIGKKYFTDFVTDETKPVICIKNPAPNTVDKLWWGDYWLGLDLAIALKNIGYEVRVDYKEEFSNRGKEIITIVIRGAHPCNYLDKSKINVLYLISCWDRVSTVELKNYDFILVCSLPKQKELQRKGLNAYYFPQFTNPTRFFPVLDGKYKHSILFVGNAYAGLRPAVKYSVDNKLPISVYGKFWEKKIDDSYIKGLYIDNNELHKYYSNADIVLNDTTDTMRQNGFVSNRIYDVTACKGFLISDYIPEIAKTYGNNIPMYKNAKEFNKLIHYYLSHPEERYKKAEAAYQITMANYTNEKMAQKFQDIIDSNKTISKMPLYKTELINWYTKHTHQPLNLDYPQTFNEKIQWLKLYDSTPIKTRLADKYLVREWVKEKIGEEYLIPLLGVYDKFEDIDFEALPDQFVIKCNHGSGWNIIVKDKSKLDLKTTKEKLDRWMHTNFAFQAGYELHYKNIIPKIVIEQYIEEIKNALYDYRFFCSYGDVKQIWLDVYSGTPNHKRKIYDKNWNELKFTVKWPRLEMDIKKPEELDKMIRFSEILSKEFSLVRVDFYLINNHIYFGEMTFTSMSGIGQFDPEKEDLNLGNMITLPKLAYNIDTGEYYKLPKRSKIAPYLFFPYYLYQKAYWQYKKYKSVEQLFLSQLLSSRIDIKNIGKEGNTVEVQTTEKLLKPTWFKNAQGQGQVLETNKEHIRFSLKAIQDGKLSLSFKGQDKRVEGTRIPLWIDYKSIKINGKEISSVPIETWHDKPFHYEMPVKDGQTVLVEIVQQPHKYVREELKNTIFKLFPNNEYIKKNVSSLLKHCSIFVKPEPKKPSRLFSITQTGAKTTLYVFGIKLKFNNKQKELLQALQQNQQTLLQALNTTARRSDKLEQQNIALSQQVNTVNKELQQAKLWLKQTHEMFPPLNKQLANAQETLLSQLVTERKVNRLAAIVSMEIKRQRNHHKEIASLLSKFISNTQTDLRYLKNLDVVKSKQLHKTAEELTQHILTSAQIQEKQLVDMKQVLSVCQKNLQYLKSVDFTQTAHLYQTEDKLEKQVYAATNMQEKYWADIQKVLNANQEVLQELKAGDGATAENLQKNAQQLEAQITASVQSQQRLINTMAERLYQQQEKSLASTSQLSNLLETLQQNNQNEQEAIKKHLHIIQNKALQQYNELNFADLLHDSTQNTPWLKDKTLSLYGWAANYSFIYTLFRILDKVSPQHILEMGLGQTTRLTSQYIAYKNPAATLDVCEHNQDWIDVYTPELPISSNIKVHHLDLEYFDYDGKKNDKYKNLALVTDNIKYNLIIVDGPVGAEKTLPRSNVMDLIPQNLAKDFIIIFDDADRTGEQNTIAQTKAKLSAQGIAFGTQQRNALKSQFLIFSKSCDFVQYL